MVVFESEKVKNYILRLKLFSKNYKEKCISLFQRTNFLLTVSFSLFLNFFFTTLTISDSNLYSNNSLWWINKLRKEDFPAQSCEGEWFWLCDQPFEERKLESLTKAKTSQRKRERRNFCCCLAKAVQPIQPVQIEKKKHLFQHLYALC